MGGTSFVYYYLQNSGATEVMQHTQPTGTADPNISSETLAPTPVASAKILTIDPATVQPFYEAKMRRIVRAAFPNQTGSGSSQIAIPTGHTLIALGIGSRTATSGTTMTSAPLHGGAAPNTYARYIAIFDVSAGSTGRGKVQLKLVTDSEFEVLAKNVENFKGAGPVDDQGVYVPPPAPTP